MLNVLKFRTNLKFVVKVQTNNSKTNINDNNQR